MRIWICAFCLLAFVKSEASITDKLYDGVSAEFANQAAKKMLAWYQTTCGIDLKSMMAKAEYDWITHELSRITSFARPINKDGKLTSVLFSWKIKSDTRSCYSVVVPNLTKKVGLIANRPWFIKAVKQKRLQPKELNAVVFFIKTKTFEALPAFKVTTPEHPQWRKKVNVDSRLSALALFGEFLVNRTKKDRSLTDILFLFNYYPGFLSSDADSWAQVVLREFYLKPRAVQLTEAEETILYYP